MQKLLIIQTAFIGDAILATGIVEKLHYYLPDAEIDFLVRKGNESLLAEHPYLHEVLVWDKKKHKLRNLWKLLLKIRRRKYDKVINVQRFAATGLLTAFSGAKETMGFNKNPLSFLFTKKIRHVIGNKEHPVHEVDRNNALIEHFTDDNVFYPRLYPADADRKAVEEYIRPPYICIAPGSVWATKRFPEEKWVAFINRLSKAFIVLLIGGKEDMVMCTRIKSAAPEHLIFDLSGRFTLLQSAALMEKAEMNYVNDSSPLHLASAMNAPVTAIYCSTLPSFGFGPLSDKSLVVETIIDLSCRPCGLHGHKACPQGHFLCAYGILDEQLPPF